MNASGAQGPEPGLHLPALTRSLLLFVMAGVATEVASRVIAARFPDRPLAPDMLLGVLPHVAGARYVSTAVIVVGLALFAVFAVRRVPGEIPAFISMIAIMYLLRAGLLVLTPLTNANDGAPTAFRFFQFGMFPSGHTASMLLLTRFTDPDRAPELRRILATLTVVVMFSMLLSRSHYSIDLAGGALLAYFIEREWATGRIFGPVKRLVMGNRARLAGKAARLPGLLHARSDQISEFAHLLV